MPQLRSLQNDLTDACIEFIHLVLSRNDFSPILKSDLDYITTCLQIVKDSILNKDLQDMSPTHSRLSELRFQPESKKDFDKDNKKVINSKRNQIPFRWG